MKVGKTLEKLSMGFDDREVSTWFDGRSFLPLSVGVVLEDLRGCLITRIKDNNFEIKCGISLSAIWLNF